MVALVAAVLAGSVSTPTEARPPRKPTPAAPPKHRVISAELRRHLLNDPFQPVKKVALLPAAVRAHFTTPDDHHPKAKPLEMADPGQPFQCSDFPDFRRGKTLPDRRLLFGAVSKDCCLVACERGGYTVRRNVVLFRRNEPSQSAELVAGSDLPDGVTDWGSLRKAEQKTLTTELFAPLKTSDSLYL